MTGVVDPYINVLFAVLGRYMNRSGIFDLTAPYNLFCPHSYTPKN
jgi:hypothetical protein